jgi:hypothetical protein
MGGAEPLASLNGSPALGNQSLLARHQEKNTVRTLLVWMFATTTFVGVSFGQNTNAPQGQNVRDTWIRQPPAPPYYLGYNIVGDGASTISPSPSIIDATVFSGADACAKIAAALAALPPDSSGNLSGTVDARGFVGTQHCGSNPFNLTTGLFTGQATVLLGAALYQATTTWIIPNRSRVLGIGAAVSTTGNTVIQWTGSTGNVPVVQLGSGTSANFGVFVGDLTIDCKANVPTLSGMTGLLNAISQEESGANDITFLSCDKYAVDLEPSSVGGSENSGPYTNLNIKYPNSNSCSSSTIAFNYSGSTKRGINGLTVVADSCSVRPLVGVDVNASSSTAAVNADVLQGIHCENVVDCIRIGNSQPTSNTVVAGVTGCPSGHGCNNVVHRQQCQRCRS